MLVASVLFQKLTKLSPKKTETHYYFLFYFFSTFFLTEKIVESLIDEAALLQVEFYHQKQQQ